MKAIIVVLPILLISMVSFLIFHYQRGRIKVLEEVLDERSIAELPPTIESSSPALSTRTLPSDPMENYVIEP